MSEPADPAKKLRNLLSLCPVVLAPMAGITDIPFRALCRSFGAGLYVSEMVIAHTLAAGAERSESLARFGPGESPRSLQLFALDASEVRAAIEKLRARDEPSQQIEHIDLNFGCPMPKIMKRGGGAAMTLFPERFEAIVRAAVEAAAGLPVTVKLRLGVDEDRLSYLECGQRAAEAGAAAVALHARTAADRYQGRARWEHIAALKERLGTHPVWGNGDIWEASDAVAMRAQTGCDAVVVGRGCLGRPWLFAELQAAFQGRPLPAPPRWGEVAQILLQHADALAESFGAHLAYLRLRKHAGWYLRAYPGPREHRGSFVRVSTRGELIALLEQLGPFNDQQPELSAWRGDPRAAPKTLAPTIRAGKIEPLSGAQLESEGLRIDGG